jgi:hypothetical protein
LHLPQTNFLRLGRIGTSRSFGPFNVGLSQGDLVASKKASLARQLDLLLYFGIAVVVAVLDYVVRVSTADWSNHFFFQFAVLFSPIVYLALILVVIMRWRHLAERLSFSTLRVFAVALCAYALITIAQVILRRQGVGSAVYSLVYPLFGSGIPFGALTLAIFFRIQRQLFSSMIVALVSVLWIVCPLAIDAMYMLQRGYRGLMPLQELAVIGSSYDFLVNFTAIAFFASVFLIPVVALVGLVVVVRSKDKLLSTAVALSLLAFVVQVMNWGGFVWD